MPGIEGLLYLVVYVSVLGILVSGVWWLLKKMKLPPWIRWALMALLAVLVLLFLSHQFEML